MVIKVSRLVCGVEKLEPRSESDILNYRVVRTHGQQTAVQYSSISLKPKKEAMASPGAQSIGIPAKLTPVPEPRRARKRLGKFWDALFISALKLWSATLKL
jgi:hypothetical protein